MAIRYLTIRRSAANLFHLLQPHVQDSRSAFHFFRSMHPCASQDFEARNFHKSQYGYSRGMTCAPNYNIDEAGAAALGLDNRVPATVITGFLGSGKVTFFLTFSTCLVYSSISFCLEILNWRLWLSFCLTFGKFQLYFI